ncbi:ELKS/Rab6-interacting/CAST family member 1-like [Pomacea canaliculata]|uniref:ELKS/Rab6-interacting/CAST family member 1-like n=1 Tax=Pomacea canaliculata TaxID=400727 RepID=UPI000D732382|nr:ELKS/Rab6-interacting/CAST family member 1-like [Pomacea canaliculata]
MASFFKKARKGKTRQPAAEACDIAPESSLPEASSEETEAKKVQVHTSTMDQELARAREELSRAVIARERCEIDLARKEAEFCHCREDLARASAIKTEVENENQKLQSEVASLEREITRARTDVERLKEDRDRLKSKLDNKKRLLVALKAEMTSSREENKRLEESIKERELTWQTIRRDLTTKREDAIREAWNVKRENEKLKLHVRKLKVEKSSALLRLWEKKQTDKKSAGQGNDDTGTHGVSNRGQDTSHRATGDRLQAKVMSLELQLFRQARLVELLLDVLQEHDTQFTKKQRDDLTSASLTPAPSPSCWPGNSGLAKNFLGSLL